MDRRLELHELLCGLIGSRNVYFQPPETVKMQVLKYPCIVYSRNNADTQFADNSPYVYQKQYKVVHIDRNPDSPIPDKIAALPMCLFDRHYTTDNLHHDSFNLYY